MAKNRRNKKNIRDDGNLFPAATDLVAALGWWREKIRAGFPPPDAVANLRELAAAAQEPELSEQFQALEKVVEDLLSQGQTTLTGAPRAVGQLTRSADSKTVFVSSATGGITCHSLKDGSLRWSIPAERAYQVGGMEVIGDTLYYTDSWNGRLYAVSARDGAETWCAEKSSDGAPLLQPAGVAQAELDGKARLLVCDSSSHRLCTFSAKGKPLAVYGVRGLVSEETSQLNTASAGTEIPPYFEYPRAVMSGTDFDGQPAAFVWDSGNCRVVVLDKNLNRKRNIPLVPENEIKPRLSGQVRVAFGRSGPVVLVVDDEARTLAVRGAYGELLLTLDFGQLCNSSRTLETFRMETGGNSNALLLTGASGRTYALAEKLLDTRALSGELLNVYPDDCNLVLAGAPEDGRAESWIELSPSLDPAALVRCLCGGEKASGELASAAARLRRFAESIAGGPLDESASALRLALNSQLDEIRSGCMTTLEKLANPTTRDIESWSDALTEVDMEVFQSRGRSSSAELAMDAQLEQIREIRPTIRRSGWKLREVDSLLLAGTDKEKLQKYSSEMLDLLVRLLDRRLDTLSAVAGRLEYDRDPQQINRQELQTAHAARLQVSAIEGAAAELAGELARIHLADTPVDTAALQAALEKSSGLDCHHILAAITGAGEETTVSLPAQPVLNGSTGETLTNLVDKMDDYLSQVKAGANGPQFGKVLERQKNLFSVKASVLANYYQVNGHGTDLLEKARSLAGDSWEANRNLRPAVAALETGS